MFDTRNIPRDVCNVCATIESHGFQAWVVGGCVRDSIIGREPNDWDVATNARPETIVTIFSKTIPTGIKHGTITVVTPYRNIEVTTFRGDGDYGDGRRPDEVVFLDSIEQDLARRDFTINAMAYRPKTNTFADPFQGALDLRYGRIRAVGNPAHRFAEDGLRVMRACRFAGQLGFFVAKETQDAIPGAIETFRKVALERVTVEIQKLVMGKNADVGLEVMRDTGLFAEVFPGVEYDTEAIVQFGWFVSFTTRLALLLRNTKYDVYSVLGNLVLSSAQKNEVTNLVHGYWNALKLTTITPSTCRRWVAEVGYVRHDEILNMLATFKQANEFVNETQRAMLGHPPLTIGELALNGEEVAEVLGVRPGREIGEALRFLLDAVLTDPSLNKPHRLTKLLIGRK